MKKILLVLLFVFAIPTHQSFAAGRNSKQDDKVIPGLTSRSGFGRFIWSPKGLSPFQVDAYGRNMLQLNLGLYNPLAFLGSSIDYIDIPEIQLNTNFRSFSSNTEDERAMFSNSGNNPYLLFSFEGVLFDFLVFRNSIEKYTAHLSNPGTLILSGSIPDDDVSSINDFIEITGSRSILEIGILGAFSETGEYTTAEVGYFRQNVVYPLVIKVDNTLAYPSLFMPEFIFDGLYLLTKGKPVEDIWPLHSKLQLGFGSGKAITRQGSDLRVILGGIEDDETFKLLLVSGGLAFERPVTENLNGGVSFDLSYRIMSGNYNTLDGKHFNLTRTDITMFMKIYVSLSIGNTEIAQ